MSTVTDAQASEALRRELQLACPNVTQEALDVAVGVSPASMSADERLAYELRMAVPNATASAIERVIQRTAPSASTARRMAEASRSRPTVTWTAEDQRAYVQRVRELAQADAGRPAAIAGAALAQVAAERQTREIRESGRR